MTDAQFEMKFDATMRTERKIGREILSLILEAEDRKIHLARGYSSLFDWLVRGKGYSEGAAHRRIQSARLLRAVPEVGKKLERGEVNLTTLAQAKSAMKTHTKKTGKKFSRVEQEEIIEEIANKTSREVQETLFEKFPETASPVHQDRRTQITDELTRLGFNFNKIQMADLKWAENFFAHSIPNGDLAEIFWRLLKDLRSAQEAKGDRAVAKMADSVAENRRVKNVATAKRVTLHRAKRTCEFVDPVTGKICGSSFMVEVDHIEPRALGGEDKIENFRCLCRAHNQYEAKRKLGNLYYNPDKRMD